MAAQNGVEVCKIVRGNEQAGKDIADFTAFSVFGGNAVFKLAVGAAFKQIRFHALGLLGVRSALKPNGT